MEHWAIVPTYSDLGYYVGECWFTMLIHLPVFASKYTSTMEYLVLGRQSVASPEEPSRGFSNVAPGIRDLPQATIRLSGAATFVNALLINR